MEVEAFYDYAEQLLEESPESTRQMFGFSREELPDKPYMVALLFAVAVATNNHSELLSDFFAVAPYQNP